MLTTFKSQKGMSLTAVSNKDKERNVIMQYVAEALEFPFVASLPKREKTKLAKLWEHLSEARAIVKEKGMIIPQHLAAQLVGVSRQRIFTLANEGRLECIEFGGVRYVTEDSLVTFAQSQRKIGVHLGGPRTNKEIWKTAVEFGRQVNKELKRTGEALPKKTLNGD